MTRAPLLILRPEPGATQTAKRAREGGWHPILSPIFRIEPIAWDAPEPGGYDALFVTSANAVRQAGKALNRYRAMPSYAVGAATARALKAAGFTDIHAGRGDAIAMLVTAADDGVTRALHLAGEDHREARHDMIAIDRRIVYRSAPVAKLGEGATRALAGGDATVLLHSGRAAGHFAHLCDGIGVARESIRIAALAPAVLDAAGAGWRASVAAAKPDDAALLAAAARLCQ